MNAPRRQPRAGSTQGSGQAAASIRRAFATRGASMGSKGSSAPSRARSALLFTVLSLLALAVVATSAAARSYESQLTEANGTAFTNPYGLAVDGSGQLWVSDVFFGGGVDKFSSSGTYEAQSTGTPWNGGYIEGLAFSNASNHLFVSDSNADDVWGLNPDASYAAIDLKEKPGAEWGPGCCFLRVAADNSAGATGGDLYVSSNSRGVFRIDASGNPINFSASAPYISGAQLTGSPTGEGGSTVPFIDSRGVAVDASGSLYVLDAGSGAVYEFKPSGEFLRAFTEASGEPLGSASAVAVDPTNENVLIADTAKGVIDEFDSSGAFLEALSGAETPAGSFGSLQGLVVNSAGELFVSDGSNRAVDVFGPAVTLAQVTYLPPSGLSQTAVTLKAEADPNGAGAITACSFQYGTTSVYGSSKACSPAAPYAGVSEVSAALSGLTAGTTYHYRVLLTDANGTKKGSDRTFHTSGPPSVGGPSVSGVTGVGATINAQVNPSGFDTHVKVLYGKTEAYGSESAEADIGSSNEAQGTSTELSGLHAGTVYHYRVLATNSEGSAESAEDQSFETEPPLTLEGQSVSAITQACATLEAQVNPKGSDTSVFFKYGPTESYGSETAPVDIGNANESQLASKEVCGLSIHTGYHFRTVAENAQGIVEGQDETFPTLPALAIGSTSVFGVNSTEATLKAQINPEGIPTTYHFEYVTEEQFQESEFAEATSTPESEPIGSDQKNHEASALLTSLTPETGYRLRVVAHNSLATVRGSNVAFTTFALATGSLPDGRVFEAVSPVATEGHAQAYVPLAGEIYINENSLFGVQSTRPFEVAPGGEAVVYEGDTPAAGGTGNAHHATGNAYLSTRSPGGGWNSVNIQPPGFGPAYQAFSSDLSVGIIGEGNGALGVLYSHSTTGGADGDYRPLYAGTRNTGETEYAGANAGAAAVPASSHLLFSAGKALIEDGGSLEAELFEAVEGVEEEGQIPKVLYDSVEGLLSLVSVLPGGKPDAFAAFGGSRGDSETRSLSHVISADGSRVFWTDAETGDLYARENPTQPQSAIMAGKCTETAKACTVQVDVPAPGAPGPGGGGAFLTASTDGSKVFFNDAASAGLTADTQAGSGVNLYEYDFTAPEAQRLSDLTPAAHADVRGISGASKDGSYLYFVAGGALAPGVTPGNCEEAKGGSEEREENHGLIPSGRACNLYLFNAGQPLTFIAALPANNNGSVVPFDDPGSGTGAGPIAGHNSGDWAAAEGFRTAEVTPDGHSLIFMSNRSLTGYDNERHDTVESLQEVFRYEAGSPGPVCISCAPSGEPPTPTAGLDSFNGPIGGLFPITKAREPRGQTRVISDDGSRVFFDSGEPLVPQDTNGWLDVYEWERDGTGSCRRSQGCVYLISGGTRDENSYLLGIGASGDDAIIATRDHLVAQDQNENMDVYDARVNGVLQPQPLPPCEGEACRGPVTPPPPTQSPGTGSFSGPGNEGPKRSKKHHKNKAHKHKKSHKRAPNSNRRASR